MDVRTEVGDVSVDAKQLRCRGSISRGRKVAYSLVLLLILLVCAEGLGRVLYAQRTRADRYMELSYYKSRAWSSEVLAAQDVRTLEYVPYVGWRRSDLVSRYVNVSDGERLTPQMSDASDKSLRVWCFGGSTMWGTGVRDAHTIPSILSRLAAEAGLDVSFRNLGESGWVSRQEVLQLELMLLGGERADVVLFYDGVNDVFSAYQTGRADGAHQNLAMFEHYFEFGYDPRRVWWRKMAIVRGVKGIQRRLFGGLERAGVDEEGDNALAEGVAKTYVDNVGLARMLAERHGIEPLFFWQPTIVFQPEYQEREREAYAGMASGALDASLGLYRSVTEIIRVTGTREGVFDVSEALGESPPEGYFIDHNHLTEEGNAVMAGVIFEQLKPVLEARIGSREGTGSAALSGSVKMEGVEAGSGVRD